MMAYTFQAHVAFGDMWTAGQHNTLLDNIAYLKAQTDLQTFDGWMGADPLVYVSATSFKITGVNVTAKYQKGTKIKLTDAAATKYFVVTASSFSTDTTVTITGGSDYSLSGGAITNPCFSYADDPQGYPDWFNFTPTYGCAGSMTYGTITTDYAKFSVHGRTVTVQVRTTAGTTGGTTSAGIYVAQPINSLKGDATDGVEGTGITHDTSTLGGSRIWADHTNHLVWVYKPDGSNWALAAGKYFSFSVSYEME